MVETTHITDHLETPNFKILPHGVKYGTTSRDSLFFQLYQVSYDSILAYHMDVLHLIAYSYLIHLNNLIFISILIFSI